MNRRQTIPALSVLVALTACHAEEPNSLSQSPCGAPSHGSGPVTIRLRRKPILVTHVAEVDLGCCRYRQVLCDTIIMEGVATRTREGWEIGLPPCSARHEEFQGRPHILYWAYHPREGEPVTIIRDPSGAEGIQRFEALPLCPRATERRNNRQAPHYI